ncbi:MAG: dual specificity protein phosphatase family protein [Candidatus Eremiobacteraeota bacterium]|nr:dual specificity protein phosphatase family protein [Candidatus Eremiobacteraeota bacterium]
MESSRPHHNCYWVTPQLMAGEYPIVRELEAGRRKLQGILDAGITEFLDLTDPADGLAPYETIEASKPFGHRRMTIRDMDVPSLQTMRQILDHLKLRLDQGHKVYVHCWGGIGRTGTVVACHLIEQGMSADQALDHIAQRWTTMEKIVRFPRSPQTDAQVEFVRHWLQPT